MPSCPHSQIRVRFQQASVAVLLCMVPSALRAQGVPVEEAAKFLLILANSAGSEGRVACKELDIKTVAVHSKVDAKANVAWSFTPEQTKFYAGQGKLVVCSSRKLFAEGGAIAFERINSRLTIFVHQANLGRSGVTLPDSFLRVAVKQ